MAYSKEYFKIQLDFARKVAELTGKKLVDVLLPYTSFYKTFRIEGWDFDKNNTVWQDFLNKLKNKGDVLEVVYDFYLEQVKEKGEKNDKKLFGCFSYEYEADENYIQVHFRNVDDPEPGALSKERIDVRKAELKKMFAEVKEEYPQAATVCGFSWLYNIEAYRRLFPPEYVNSCKTVKNWFRSAALWGQFLDSAGEVKQDLASKFRGCIEKQTKFDNLLDCFPYKVLEPEMKKEIFFRFYGV